MLKLTDEKPVVGSLVGYLHNIIDTIGGSEPFEKKDIGQVVAVLPDGRYQVKFPFDDSTCEDNFSGAQLVLIK